MLQQQRQHIGVVYVLFTYFVTTCWAVEMHPFCRV
jgi:hypothetical protein